MKFTELKEKVGAQISQSAHFYVHSMILITQRDTIQLRPR